MDTETPLRIDHIRLKNPSRMVNGFRWFWTHRESREGWLVLMNTGEVRLYDVDKRSADLQEQSPILSAPSPSDVDTKLRLRSVRIRVERKWRRIDFTGRERAPGVGLVSLGASAGGVFLEGLGELGDAFEWTAGGVRACGTPDGGEGRVRRGSPFSRANVTGPPFPPTSSRTKPARHGDTRPSTVPDRPTRRVSQMLEGGRSARTCGSQSSS